MPVFEQVIGPKDGGSSRFLREVSSNRRLFDPLTESIAGTPGTNNTIEIYKL